MLQDYYDLPNSSKIMPLLFFALSVTGQVMQLRPFLDLCVTSPTQNTETMSECKGAEHDRGCSSCPMIHEPAHYPAKLRSSSRFVAASTRAVL